MYGRDELAHAVTFEKEHVRLGFSPRQNVAVLSYLEARCKHTDTLGQKGRHRVVEYSLQVCFSNSANATMPYMMDHDDFGDRLYWDKVTPENIQELRERLLQWPERHELCYPDELQRVMEDDDYCRNIVCQMRLNMPSAHKFVAEMLTWRRAMGLKELREEHLPKAVLERCIVYPYGKDKSGCQVSLLKMIKGWLPFGVERLKTVNKKDIQQYIDAKYLPVRMGGVDTYEYTYTPGSPLGDGIH
ncbi:hypothetical protein HPB51_014661 [Rhipicephalus microplus]|uniref:Uncharacterized protein n=1 Tax=Rhipicephalus microplus TaxID=6941 RepID=A0A9J6F483_RHIMP|nr:hypothetical protein HPB51_014661 [Rhipicephalus microplus]